MKTIYSTTFALVLLNIFNNSRAFSLGKRGDPYTPIASTINCSPFDYKNKDDNTHWKSVGDLKFGGVVNGKLDKSDVLVVDAKHGGWQHGLYTHYTYTFTTGNTSANSKRIFIEVARHWGKGLGQQFRVHFYNIDKIEQGVYWITPNQHCEIDTSWNPADTWSVTVDARDWNAPA